MQNMKRQLSRHNKHLLQQYLENKYPDMKQVIKCNCQRSVRDQCPMPGQCNVYNVVYESTVTRADNGHHETYTGVTKDFKQRYSGHKRSMGNRDANQNTLSTYIWNELKDKGNIPYDIRWRVIDRGPTFNPVNYVCRLCTLEKYHILFNPAGASLNQRSEFFSICRHEAHAKL